MIASLETSSSFTAWIVTSALAWAFLLAPLPMILSRALRFSPNFSQLPAIFDDLSAISCHFLRPFRLSGPVFFLPPFTSHARASRRFDCIGLVDSARWPRWHFQTGGSTTCTGDASFSAAPGTLPHSYGLALRLFAAAWQWQRCEKRAKWRGEMVRWLFGVP